MSKRTERVSIAGLRIPASDYHFLLWGAEVNPTMAGMVRCMEENLPARHETSIGESYHLSRRSLLAAIRECYRDVRRYGRSTINGHEPVPADWGGDLEGIR